MDGFSRILNWTWYAWMWEIHWTCSIILFFPGDTTDCVYIYIYVKVEEGHHVYIWYIITYICIYMYIYIKYVCNYACVYVYIHMCVCVCTYTYIYIHMFLYYWSLDPTFAPENPPCFSSSLRFALRGPGSDGENRGPKNKPWLFQY